MCGISGVLNYSKNKIDLKKTIKEIVDFQINRGPDAKGIWESHSKNVVFGHNRLSIIELTNNANQPMLSLDRNYIITFNGEIYNYKELRNLLKEKNIKFKTYSDTEVILEAYKFWGINFLNYLRGMYSFAIYDQKQKKILVARDPFGIKPLYYSDKDCIFAFASQAKALLKFEHISKKISNIGLCNYYQWGNSLEPDTLFKDIKILERGTCLLIDSSGKKKKINFFNLKDEILNSKSFYFNSNSEGIECLKDAIDETVKYHEISDVPISFMLSSGIDSSVLLASLNNKEKNSALTLDFGFKNPNMNEVDLASKSAKMNNIKYESIKIKDNYIPSHLHNFFQMMDLPTNDGLNNYLISHYAKKKKIKVLVSGIGGDEFFCGYPSFSRIPLLVKYFNILPRFKSLGELSENISYNLFKNIGINTKYSSVYNLSKDYSSAFLLQRSLFLRNELKELIENKELNEYYKEVNIINKIKEDIKDIEQNKLKIMLLEIKYYLSSKLLTDCDWTSMSNSIEMRTPFIDFFFFKKILPILKSNLNIDKKFLLKCFQNKLPKELFFRKKTGFEIPYKKYLLEMNQKINYSNPIKDWSIFSIKNYFENIN